MRLEAAAIKRVDPLRVLVVEDDTRMLELLCKGLQEHGHITAAASDGMEAIASALTHEFDVVILDIGLPLCTGYEVAERLRAQQNRAVILMLTAYDMEDDVIRGLDLGADDYMVKPFSFPELIARIGSITRRRLPSSEGKLKTGDLVLDKVKHNVFLAGVQLHPTRTEFLLLERLMDEVGRTVTRKELIERAWGPDAEVSSGALDTFINSLRRKLSYPNQRSLIKTVRGIGYFLPGETLASRKRL
jgi:DNA-binding response OmpR family regulator